MPVLADITNERFGRLIAKQRVQQSNSRPKWLCECDCGRKTLVNLDHLRKGRIRSCGCLRMQVSAKRMTTHGHTAGRKMSPEYISYVGMKQRCSDSNHKDYMYYGGRGIKVCSEWIDDFQAFFDHIGPKEDRNLTVDRIDPNKNYEPGNVKWVTRAEQNRNRRWCRKFW